MLVIQSFSKFPPNLFSTPFLRCNNLKQLLTRLVDSIGENVKAVEHKRSGKQTKSHLVKFYFLKLSVS